MAKIALASLRAHKRRLAGMFLSVVVGVAFLSGTLVLGDTLQSNFDKLFAEANAGTDVVVRPVSDIDGDYANQAGVMDASVARTLAQIDGVAAVAPAVEGYGRILDADGEPLGGNGPPTVAAGWVEDEALNPWRITEGRAPAAPDEVVLNRGAAEGGDLRVGDRTVVQVPEPLEVTVVGIATFGEDADGIGPTTTAFFDFESAQRQLTGGTSNVTSVLLRAEDGVSPEELVARVEPRLPGGLEAVTGSQLTDDQLDSLGADFLDAFRTFLVVFAGVALLVGAFSIHNTFSILVAQRAGESALLRGIGATRRQVLGWVVAEAAVVGVVASVAGLVAGLGLASGLKGLFDAFGFALPAGGLVFEASTAVVCLVVGTGVTLLAGIGPATRASRIPPVAALRTVALDRSAASSVRAMAGAVVLAVGVVLVLVTVASEGDIAVAGLGAVLSVAGAAVSGPVAARPASRLLAAPLPRLRGAIGTLARENAARNPRRTSGTAVALMVGIGVVTLFTVFAASIEASVDEAVAGSFEGDLVVGGASWEGGTVSPRFASDVEELDEVERVTALANGFALVDGESRQVTVADPRALPGVLDLDVVQGSLDAVDRGSLAVSADEAGDHGWEVGTAIDVAFPDGGRRRLPIAAVYDAADVAGAYLLPRAVWEAHSPQSVDTAVFVALRDGVPLADGKDAVQEVADRYYAGDVMDRGEYVDELAGGVDQMLGLVYVMLFLAILIALMGIANTMTLAVHERTSEIGLLRAVGATRAQVRSMVRWEAVVVAVLGSVAGTAFGVFFGWALVRAAGADGEFRTFAVPLGELAIVVLVGALAGVVAGARPARRAARTDVLRAIAST
ncbi:MAG: ABC transporter substrate-binding protein [Acidimicrobiia bacterium]|nr:MAG: ABC transporter substrate-binding protein [Acidimicrobiia bacterium]